MAISVVKAAQVAQAAVLILFVCAMPLCFGNMGAPELRTAKGKFTIKGSKGPMEMEENDNEVVFGNTQDKMSFTKDCGACDAVPAQWSAPDPQDAKAALTSAESDVSSCESAEPEGYALDPPCEEAKSGFSAFLPFLVAFLAGGFFCLDVFEMLPVF